MLVQKLQQCEEGGLENEWILQRGGVIREGDTPPCFKTH